MEERSFRDAERENGARGALVPTGENLLVFTKVLLTVAYLALAKELLGAYEAEVEKFLFRSFV